MLDPFLARFLRHHTPANTDQKRGILFLQMLKLTGNGERTLLCMLTHRAGIDENQIRRLFIFGDFVFIGKDGCNNLTISYIHLTSVGFDKKFLHSQKLGCKSTDFFFKG